MEFGSSENTQDKNNSSSKQEQPNPSASAQNVRTKESLSPGDTFGEVTMEVAVTADEVMRAGGFGATDDLSSILPVASDFTDFEDHLRKVHDYENSKDEKDIVEVDKVDSEDDAIEAVNIEAARITSDDMIRAGGFGATDGISNFLPVASDFTDFEANLRGAREYEDQNEEINRPGLGYTSESK